MSKHLVFAAVAFGVAVLTIGIDDRPDLDELLLRLHVWGLVALILIMVLALIFTLRRNRTK